jgi:general secretion pathway protein F
MAIFIYTALKRDGSISNGELTANDRADAFRRLDRNGLQPVSLKPKDGAAAATPAAPPAVKPAKAGKPEEPAADTDKAAKVLPPNKAALAKASAKATKVAEAKMDAVAKADNSLPKGPVKLSRKQIIMFTEELSDLLSAGLQLEPALRIMESRDELSALKDVTIILRQRIRDGGSFSNALRESSKNFGDLYCNMAAAGEISGALSKILRRQAEYMTTIQELQGKVTTAMIYPAFLMVAGVGVGFLFVTNLIPQLAALLKSMGKPMPLPARILQGATDWFGTWWWAVFLLIGLAIWGFNQLVEMPQYKEKWHQKKLGMPFFGPLLRSRFYVQMLETLANLVGNGLPMMRALELTRDATVNLYLKGLLSKVTGMVGEGGSLSKAFKKVDFFPPLLTDMVAVGEQTGDIQHSLERTALRYDKELQNVIDRVSALVQPAIIVIMAVLVGTMAYMMISVIMDSVGSMKR